MKKLLFTAVLILLASNLFAQKIDILQQAASIVDLKDLCSEPYRPYPSYDDRTYWEGLPSVIKTQALGDAERALSYDWRTVSVTSYLDFKRKGVRIDNDLHIAARHSALASLVLGELIEGQGRFMDAIINGVWSLCEQSTWVATAHISLQGSGSIPDVNKRAIDLSSGETANVLSLAHYFFNEQFTKISPLITARLEQELDNHIFKVYLGRDDLWWMVSREGAFVNNWTPWCNFNVLLSALLVEKDAARREAILRKSMRSVDQFINYYGNDGGCEEGPTYWDHAGGKMMEYLALLKRFSGGAIDMFGNERIQNMGLYIAKAHIDSLYFVNFADAEARAVPIPTTIYRYGREIGSESLKRFGSYIGSISGFAAKPLGGSLDMMLWQTELYDEIVATPAQAPMYGSVWLSDVEFLLARSRAGSNRGLTFAAKGGFNDESHNHNDAGAFLLYHNGVPMIVDAGVGTYTAKTFSAQRYTIWTMQSEYHNLPVVNGFGQRYGKKYRANDVTHRDNGKILKFSLNLTDAYPEDARCKNWTREYVLDRGKGALTIADSYELAEIKGATTLNFIAEGSVDASVAGKIIIKNMGQRVVLDYDATLLECGVEILPLDDKRLTKIWGSELRRISLTVKNPQLKNALKATIKGI